MGAGLTIQMTTKRREWWGWFGSMAWILCMINGYVELPNGYSDSNMFWCTLIFQVLMALTVILVNYRFSRGLDGLSKLAYYTTPVAIVITAVSPASPARRTLRRTTKSTACANWITRFIIQMTLRWPRHGSRGDRKAITDGGVAGGNRKENK